MLSGWFVLVDDKAPEGSTGALGSERAWTTFFACPDVVEGSIAINSATVVEELAALRKFQGEREALIVSSRSEYRGRPTP